MFLPFGTSFTSGAMNLLEHSDACSYFEKWHRYRSFLFFLLNGKPLIESLHGHIYEISSNTDDDLSVLGMRLDGNSTRKSAPLFCVVNHLVYRHTQCSLTGLLWAITANSEAIQAQHGLPALPSEGLCYPGHTFGMTQQGWERPGDGWSASRGETWMMFFAKSLDLIYTAGGRGAVIDWLTYV